MKQLRIAQGLSLPLEAEGGGAVTQTYAVIAKRRAGKSYFARRFVEQLAAAGQQVVMVDPKGDQWGIRSSSDGKGPGLPIVILGGERGDVKLEPNAGEVVAKLVVEERASVLLDLSLFRKSEVASFMGGVLHGPQGFLEALYRLKAREQNRTAMMLVLDEADAIAPQKPQHGEERMLGACEDIVRRGGQRGIGCMFLSQRTAVLNKNVLTQAQIMVALRTIAPQDLKAMDAWIDVHGTREQRVELMATLPSLPIGDAWVWSPGWPTARGIFQRIHTEPIETFDSGATPRPGERRIEPKKPAEVDLEALRRQMAATIERAKAEDPRELKKQIADLKRQLEAMRFQAERQKEAKEARPAKPREVPVLKDAQVKRLEAVAGRIDRAMVQLGKWAQLFTGTEREVRNVGAEISAALTAARVPHSLPNRRKGADRADVSPLVTRPAPVVRPRGNGRDATAEGLTGPQQKILDAAAFLESLGIRQPNVVQLALFAGLSATGGYWRANIGRLRTLGLIEGTSLTEAGRAAAREADIQTVEQLHEHVYTNLLTGPQRTILRVLIDAYPQGFSADELGKRASMEPSGGYWRANLGRLRSLGLISKGGPIQALPVLFLEGGP